LALGRRNLVLVGFMGSGKSSLGRMAARRLHRPFVDTDAWVESRSGQSVADIFRRQGEAAFRRLEAEAVAAAAARRRLVVATGGGALRDPLNLRRLRQGGVLVALQAEPEVLLARAGRLPGVRPLLDVPDPLGRVRELLAERAELYRQADLHLDTTHLGLQEALEALLALVGEGSAGATRPR
jgi:shikimate kinase